jgi:hypothetical protein
MMKMFDMIGDAITEMALIGSTAITSLAAGIGGAYIGYCAAIGQQIEPSSLEKVIGYGPAVANATIAALGGVLSSPSYYNRNFSNLGKGVKKAAIYGGITALAELAGIGAGYVIGKVN